MLVRLTATTACQVHGKAEETQIEIYGRNERANAHQDVTCQRHRRLMSKVYSTGLVSKSDGLTQPALFGVSLPSENFS